MAYTINDFHLGECVYHASNNKYKMIITEIDIEADEISCRWIDKNGQPKSEEFSPVELVKCNDTPPAHGLGGGILA